ncbi:MAG: LPS export ABC transporter periplasmic protein LptC [Alphaproteobacteria bacterium]|nr:LPS export ABC transporter periplasmic protein LptC [Alphaproteobacteria bacterium]
MSSPTEPSRMSQGDQRAKRAAARARLAPLMGVGAVVVGVGIVGTFLAQSFFAKPEDTEVQPTKAAPTQVEKVVSGQASRITGFDKNKQPFELTAKQGLQDKINLDLVHLDGVTGSFRRADGGAIGIASHKAQYDAKTKGLELEGEVILQEEGRYVARMQAASVNVDDHSLVSKTPVKVDTATGTVEADGMTVGPYGGRILFSGHVKAKFATNSTYGVKQ